MALPLEETIMREIGLGQNYRWYNGSGSCQYIRQEAARRLSDAIKKHHKAGAEIVQPISSLVRLVKDVAARGDEDQYVLTKTWQAASYVIAHHIHQFHVEEKSRAKETRRLAAYLRKTYLKRARQREWLIA